SAVCRTTTKATLAGLCTAIGTALAPGLPVAAVQLWYLHDEHSLRELAPAFDLLNLFSPPEMVRGLLVQGPTSLHAQLSGSGLAFAYCVHLLIYVLATGWLWQSLCRRLRVETKPAEPALVLAPALP